MNAPQSNPSLQSDLALWAYEQSFFGTDRLLGCTLDGAIEIPASVTDWYVRHADRDINDAFVARLATEITAKAIPGLSLASCHRLTDRALSPLANLEVLDLFHTPIGDDGLAALGRLPNLRSLTLAATQITDRTLGTLSRFERLERLDLGFTRVTADGLASLRDLPHLRALDLRGVAIGDEAMAALADLTQLTELGLEQTKITDAGLARLSPLAQRLTRLDLGYTRLTGEAIPAFTGFGALQTLVLRGTRIGREHDGALRARHAGLIR